MDIYADHLDNSVGYKEAYPQYAAFLKLSNLLRYAELNSIDDPFLPIIKGIAASLIAISSVDNCKTPTIPESKILTKPNTEIKFFSFFIKKSYNP